MSSEFPKFPANSRNAENTKFKMQNTKPKFGKYKKANYRKCRKCETYFKVSHFPHFLYFSFFAFLYFPFSAFWGFEENSELASRIAPPRFGFKRVKIGEFLPPAHLVNCVRVWATGVKFAGSPPKEGGILAKIWERLNALRPMNFHTQHRLIPPVMGLEHGPIALQ